MKLAILFGGNSYEHEISIVGTVVLKKVINTDLTFIFCGEKRRFYLIPSERMNSRAFSGGACQKEKELFLRQKAFYHKSLWSKKNLDLDCVINLIHGRDGEDGKIASLLEFFDVEFIGPRVEASVLSFNKEFTKLYAQSVGVKTLDYQMLRKSQKQDFTAHFPCILEPVRLGSSIGISIAKNEKELDYAKNVGFEFDTDILVEDFKSNTREYNLAGCMIKDEFISSIIEEPKKKEFLNLEQKHLSFSGRNELIEADSNEELRQKLKDNSAKIHNPLSKGALIRCDFFTLDNEVYLNEINPNPGSLANYLFKDFNKIIEQLALSIESEKKIKITYEFLHSING